MPCVGSVETNGWKSIGMTSTTANQILAGIADDDYRSFDMAAALAIKVLQAQVECLYAEVAVLRNALGLPGDTHREL